MKVIVLEGIDGSGKSLLAKELADYLCSKGIKAKYIHFPDKNATMGSHIYDMLNKAYGINFLDVNYFAQYMMYALDRYEFFTINKHIYDDYVLVCDRYTTSSMVYQGSSLYMAIRNAAIKDGMSMEDADEMTFEKLYKLEYKENPISRDYYFRCLEEGFEVLIPSSIYDKPPYSKEVKIYPELNLGVLSKFIDETIPSIEYATLGIPYPTFTFYINTNLNTARKRLENKDKDSFEESDFFMKTLDAASFNIAIRHNWLFVDNNGTPEESLDAMKKFLDDNLTVELKYIQA